MTTVTEAVKELLFTKSIAAKLVNTTPNNIYCVQYMSGTLERGTVKVFTKDDTEYTFTCDAFLQQFIRDRRNRAKEIEVKKLPYEATLFVAENPEKGTQYKLQVFFDKVICSCPDFANQVHALGTMRVCCKHSYAVLSKLRCNSLREWIEKNKPSIDLLDQA